MTVDLITFTVTVVFVAVWAFVWQIMYREARERRRIRRSGVEQTTVV